MRHLKMIYVKNIILIYVKNKKYHSYLYNLVEKII